MLRVQRSLGLIYNTRVSKDSCVNCRDILTGRVFLLQFAEVNYSRYILAKVGRELGIRRKVLVVALGLDKVSNTFRSRNECTAGLNTNLGDYQTYSFLWVGLDREWGGDFGSWANCQRTRAWRHTSRGSRLRLEYSRLRLRDSVRWRLVVKVTKTGVSAREPASSSASSSFFDAFAAFSSASRFRCETRAFEALRVFSGSRREAAASLRRVIREDAMVVVVVGGSLRNRQSACLSELGFSSTLGRKAK